MAKLLLKRNVDDLSPDGLARAVVRSWARYLGEVSPVQEIGLFSARTLILASVCIRRVLLSGDATPQQVARLGAVAVQINRGIRQLGPMIGGPKSRRREFEDVGQLLQKAEQRMARRQTAEAESIEGTE